MGARERERACESGPVAHTCMNGMDRERENVLRQRFYSLNKFMMFDKKESKLKVIMIKKNFKEQFCVIIRYTS